MPQSWLSRTANQWLFDPVSKHLNPFKTADQSERFFVKLQRDLEHQGAILTIRNSLFTAIDTKVGALLTHISLLIAILAIFYSMLATGVLYKIVLALEIISYLIATMICLRCLRFDLPDLDDENDPRTRHAYHELMNRRALFTLALDITFGTTIVLVLTFFVHVIAT